MTSTEHDAPLTHGRFDLSGMDARMRPPHQCECRYPTDDQLTSIGQCDADDATITRVLSDLGQAMACTLITDDVGRTNVEQVDWDVSVHTSMADGRAGLILNGHTAVASFTLSFTLVPCTDRGDSILVSEGLLHASMAANIIPEVLNGVIRYWPTNGIQARQLHHMLRAVRTDLARIDLARTTVPECDAARVSSESMERTMVMI